MEGGEQTPTRFTRPAVDIFETNEGLTMKADLPGVNKEDLTIDIDRDLLTLKAETKPQPKGEAIRKEFELRGYFRQFQLPDEIDAGKVSADLKNGVLTLDLPKAEAAKPRRIEIASA
ncbi:Hsp20/alpha crystallin family protein [Desulfuromonas sp.]|uniref:Hsp20/alpha crystallin family protein n=1 Tax=Desulfuromonas sp. TaxID=892 RepID=UPI0025B7D66C|nr:Hsp20/alpha crystallin family protein [Desulfuromonas sp.]